MGSAFSSPRPWAVLTGSSTCSTSSKAPTSAASPPAKFDYRALAQPTTAIEPTLIYETWKTPSGSNSSRPALSEPPPRRAACAMSAGYATCYKCPGKRSTVGKTAIHDARQHDGRGPSARERATDGAGSASVAMAAGQDACTPRQLDRARELKEACAAYVALSEDCRATFRDDLAERCDDWLRLFGSKVSDPPLARASLVNFELSVDIGDISNNFDLFPYGFAARSGDSDRYRQEIDFIFNQHRCYFECIRLHSQSVWHYLNHQMKSVRKRCPTTSTHVALLEAMVAVKVELLYRIKKQASVKLPRNTLEHSSSRYGLQAVAATFAWLVRNYPLEAILEPTRRLLLPIYERAIVDLLDDCRHLEALLGILPDRFACFCCTVCERKEAGRDSRSRTFFSKAGHLLDALAMSVATCPSETARQRRRSYLALACRVVRKKHRDLCRELDMIRTRDPLAYHRVQLRRRGVAAATETGEVIDDVYRVVEPRHFETLFSGDLLGKILFR
ncbi:uncharacterized protein PFL1_04099 [Pseudozyma flocculosa PF-1]|uniref:Uncharacterized protein n=1 Tax=Pseudozyma flocculosa PF-1 TaxID=1277687 RepID=A0A061H5S3_9BASI|nr:uncharacterized protein PFL1_04099 [Pseudozyma flocculosa PF-1]EPQ28272.1 hypothetical protein PFL1_04099 [Pseudozyma flocculosa PF-1]